MSNQNQKPKETVYAEAFLYYRMETIPTICDSRKLLSALDRVILPMCPALDKVKLTLTRVSALPQGHDARLVLVVPDDKGINVKQIKKALEEALRTDQSYDGEYFVKVTVEEKEESKPGLFDRLKSILLGDTDENRSIRYLDYTLLKRLATDSVRQIAVVYSKKITQSVPKLDKKLAAEYEAFVCTANEHDEVIAYYWVVKLDDAIRQDLKQGGVCIYEI